MTINKVKVIIFIVLNEGREGREDIKPFNLCSDCTNQILVIKVTKVRN